MTEYISREDAISHPFANGRYDHDNANIDFILGHESYREWLENLPSIKIDDGKIKNGDPVEVLKATAKALGYNIVKVQKTEKLLPCICGSNRRGRWTGTGAENKVILICERCGRKANGKSEREARHNWNEMIKNELANE